MVGRPSHLVSDHQPGCFETKPQGIKGHSPEQRAANRLRYRLNKMKKTLRKLVVRSETIRALHALGNRDLTYAVGGTVVPVRESGRINCPAPLIESAAAACG